jgi:hypothetical protein
MDVRNMRRALRVDIVRLVALVTLSLAAGCGGTSQGEDDGSSTSGNGGSGSSNGGRGGSTGNGGSASSGGSSGSGASSSTGSGGGGGSNSGGTNNGGTNAGGSGGADECTAEAFDRSCTRVEDCLLVDHTTSCCGDQLRMAINAEEVHAFGAAETYCSSLFPACGCAAQGVAAEDGSLVPFGSEDLIVARCTDGVCSSHYDGPTFQCANHSCTEEQLCTVVIGGPAGSEPSGSCSPDNGCTDCDCIGTSVGCQCVVQAGNITVTCAAP